MEPSILLVGDSSFLGQALLAGTSKSLYKPISARATPQQSDFRGIGAIVNCALDDRLINGPYSEAFDVDLRWAEAAAKAGIHFVMISSRKVYALDEQFGATEESRLEGLDQYGRNKIETETRLTNMMPFDKLTILRVGNLIGFEYPRRRLSLMGFILQELAQKGHIDMTQSPLSRRDCLPVEKFAEILSEISKSRYPGIYNVGSGFGTKVGNLAQWVIDGFDRGDLRTTDTEVSGEFYLNIEKLRRIIPVELYENDLQEYCRGLGLRLASIHT